MQAFYLDFATRDLELGKLIEILTAYPHLLPQVPNLEILQ